MSGEYYCLRDESHTKEYIEDYELQHEVSARRSANPNGDDNRSLGGKKSQDIKLKDMEQQLEMAESKCNNLKTQLEAMRRIYVLKQDASHLSKTGSTANTVAAANHFHGKRRKNKPFSDEANDHIYFQNPKSSSSEDVSSSIPVSSKIGTILPAMRQTSKAITTDNTGEAVITINNILTGITNSVNRLSQLHASIDERDKSNVSRERESRRRGRKVSHHLSTVEDAKAIADDIYNIQQKQRHHQANEICDSIEENKVFVSIQDKQPSNISVKSRDLKRRSKKISKSSVSKIQHSAASLELRRNVRSTARHVENTTNIPLIGKQAVEKRSHPLVIARKRKKSLKRLKPGSKTVVRTNQYPEMIQSIPGQPNANLVELYHNIRVRESDSDASQNASHKRPAQKPSQTTPLQVKITPVAPQAPKTSHNHVPKDVPPLTINSTTFTSKNYQNHNNAKDATVDGGGYKVLTPILEDGNYFGGNGAQGERYYGEETTVLRNYQLPTLASRLRRANKCYLQNFNFRSIPFCAAKSTTASHNIGINIQQVMSIMKTRHPITVISPVLAHNISLAAGKFTNQPFSAFVSSLGSKLGFDQRLGTAQQRIGSSQCARFRPQPCPLTKVQCRYNPIEEDERECIEEDVGEEYGECSGFVGSEAGGSGDKKIIWTSYEDKPQSEKCTCVQQEGLTIDEVLTKFNSQPQVKQQDASRHVQRRNWTSTSIRKDSKKVQPKVEVARPHLVDGNEGEIRDGLQILHEEFDSLNRSYEQLLQRVTDGDAELNSDTEKKLSEMERKLDDKEKEVKMVMNLYSGFNKLKTEVKVLKERASQASMKPALQGHKKDQTVEVGLAKILKRIQAYVAAPGMKKQNS